MEVYEKCGGSRKINLYKKIDNSTSSDVGPLYPPVGSRFTEVFTDNGTPMPVAAVAISNNTSPTAPNTPQSSNPPSSSTSQSSNPPSNSTPGSNGSMDPTSSAPSTPSTTATPATAATPSTEPVCHKGKLIKRRPSFRKREPAEPFHVPANHRKHRRMHH